MRCPCCFSTSKVIRKGLFARCGGRTRRQRYRCKNCGRNFSEMTGTIFARQLRPDLESKVFYLLISGVSMRRIARLHQTTQTTVARKLVRLGAFAKVQHQWRLKNIAPVSVALFDEMETFEHTKCKPVSIVVAVEEHSRIILNATAVSMPPKGRLVHIARKRYPPRKDGRRKALFQALSTISSVGAASLKVKSDQCPRYPAAVRRWLPRAKHETFKGRRGCVVGQGELKAGGFDPLFSLNHTCAMVRDNVKRLSRRTWCTTKRIDRLQCFLNLYICYHNEWIGMRKCNRRLRTRGQKTGGFQRLLEWNDGRCGDRDAHKILPLGPRKTRKDHGGAIQVQRG